MSGLSKTVSKFSSTPRRGGDQFQWGNACPSSANLKHVDGEMRWSGWIKKRNKYFIWQPRWWVLTSTKVAYYHDEKLQDYLLEDVRVLTTTGEPVVLSTVLDTPSFVLDAKGRRMELECERKEIATNVATMIVRTQSEKQLTLSRDGEMMPPESPRRGSSISIEPITRADAGKELEDFARVCSDALKDIASPTDRHSERERGSQDSEPNFAMSSDGQAVFLGLEDLPIFCDMVEQDMLRATIPVEGEEDHGAANISNGVTEVIQELCAIAGLESETDRQIIQNSEVYGGSVRSLVQLLDHISTATKQPQSLTNSLMSELRRVERPQT